jgi:hypothetical protein
MCGWTFAGARVIPIGYERWRRSWSACNPTSPGDPCSPAGDAESDPVAQRIVARLDRPGGNVTGFAYLEATLRNGFLA